MTAPLTPQAPLPQIRFENVGRGALFALLVLPVGIVIWTLLWSAGLVASIVAFVVALGAVWLYRKGAGGVISRTGAWIVTGLVVATLLISFLVGMIVDYAGGLSHLDYVGAPGFFEAFNQDFAANFTVDLPSFGLALLFGALGSFRVLGRAFATARQTQTAQLFGTAPAAPQSGMQLNPESTGTVSSSPEDGTPTAR